MLVVTHPTGNANTRQALLALYERQLLQAFFTTVAWSPQSAWARVLPEKLNRELSRRTYDGIPNELIHTHSAMELGRLVAKRLGIQALTSRSNAPFSIANVTISLDQAVSKYVAEHRPAGVYAYCTTALRSFRVAERHGLERIYELPSAYWHFWNDLMREECELQPEFAASANPLHHDPSWVRRQDDELALAEHVIVPSDYVRSSLPPEVQKRARVIPYGSPVCASKMHPRHNRKLRVLFVGGLTQAKGISYLVQALSDMLGALDVTLIGTRLRDCQPVDAFLQNCRWLGSVPHSTVLQEMENHDVFVFPTLSEGLSLAVLEAMSRGMVVITTPHSGASGIIEDGVNGYIVPIRSSNAIVEKLHTLDSDRDRLAFMSEQALHRSRVNSWTNYRETLGAAVSDILKVAKDVAFA